MSKTQFYDKWQRVNVKTLAVFLVNDLIESYRPSPEPFFSDRRILRRWTRSDEIQNKLITRLNLIDYLRPCLLHFDKPDVANWPRSPVAADIVNEAPRLNRSQREAALEALRASKSARRPAANLLRV